MDANFPSPLQLKPETLPPKAKVLLKAILQSSSSSTRQEIAQRIGQDRLYDHDLILLQRLIAHRLIFFSQVRRY